LLFLMAPLPPLTIVDPYAWERSSVTRLALGDLVSAGQLAANKEGRPAEWIVPPAGDHAPNPPSGYVVSFTRFHERGFAGGRGHGAEASSSHAGRSAPVEGFAGDPPAFADAQGEQELWGELRNHGAALDRALNEALRIHGGPAWRVFQVECRCLFSLFFLFLRAVLAP
jgi:hypothetical protein